MSELREAPATDVEFDPFSDTFFVDPYPTYKRLRDEAPVYYNEKYDFYALSRYDDVAWGQKDYETFSSAYGIELGQVKSGKKPQTPMIIMMDPPDHRRHRSLVNRVFTPRAIASLEPMVREVIAGYLSQVDPKGFDGVQDFAAYFPVEIICRMLGIPPSHRQQIRLWIDKSIEREPGSYKIPKAGMQAGMEMGTYLYQVITERRADLQDDMISDLIRAEVAGDDGQTTALDDIEIAGFLSLLGGAGAETVIKLIGNAMVLFAEHPEQWAELQANRQLIPSAVEEVLRHQAPSQYNVRRSIKDVEVHGVHIPEGSPVLMLVGSANRDERAIPHADAFDIKRTAAEGAAKNIGFGYGVHSCLGAALARLEGQVALELLLDFMPEYVVDRDSMKRVMCSNVAGWSSFQVHVTKPGHRPDVTP